MLFITKFKKHFLHQFKSFKHFSNLNLQTGAETVKCFRKAFLNDKNFVKLINSLQFSQLQTSVACEILTSYFLTEEKYKKMEGKLYFHSRMALNWNWKISLSRWQGKRICGISSRRFFCGKFENIAVGKYAQDKLQDRARLAVDLISQFQVMNLNLTKIIIRIWVVKELEGLKTSLIVFFLETVETCRKFRWPQRP